MEVHKHNLESGVTGRAEYKYAVFKQCPGIKGTSQC